MVPHLAPRPQLCAVGERVKERQRTVQPKPVVLCQPHRIDADPLPLDQVDEQSHVAQLVALVRQIVHRKRIMQYHLFPDLLARPQPVRPRKLVVRQLSL